MTTPRAPYLEIRAGVRQWVPVLVSRKGRVVSTFRPGATRQEAVENARRVGDRLGWPIVQGRVE